MEKMKFCLFSALFTILFMGFCTKLAPVIYKENQKVKNENTCIHNFITSGVERRYIVRNDGTCFVDFNS